MAVFGSGKQIRVRKFCTSTGSSLYHYLLLFPGASFCQNMNTVSALTTKTGLRCADHQLAAGKTSFQVPHCSCHAAQPVFLPGNTSSTLANVASAYNSVEQDAVISVIVLVAKLSTYPWDGEVHRSPGTFWWHTFHLVVENTMLNYLPRQLLAPPREEKKMPVNSVRDHPDYGLAKQLADAGF
ncbi:unnamed protein product [Heligmosomoides polygyrus]|uniref:Uncharacterized protein n=1 Tax=Heligmosomoides polygyrus TaxID=6339 RepID=A0A3P8AFR8_HELPZ|nr:unnamed protein product [Heligmosomoides polygyrus]